ncbi:hypothetical protein CEXT_491191 [Caerostris extrusa]|uniref:Protein kinase domain-containing protein n=1 Tax=Caerostris extrusa TaxID=172846 RepID=A0AAV4UGC6_CAEEX|nr:hypothetical protein CEXT_491191 [Caerostris extrusa]
MNNYRKCTTPEVLHCALEPANDEGYSFAADWWSLGVTAYEMMCSMRPYHVQSSTSVEETFALINNSCLRFPKKLDEGLVSLVQHLLKIDPTERIASIQQLQKHNYMATIDLTAVYNKQYTPSFVPSKKQLNCDPTFELEEMIIEAKPLHKKKKRLSKRNKARAAAPTPQLSQDDER